MDVTSKCFPACKVAEVEVGWERDLSIISYSLTRSFATVEVVNSSADTLDVGLNNFEIISKFVDDRKIGISIITNHGWMSLQEDLRKISEWSQRWKMSFNVNKCHILQVGTRNKKKMNTK